MIFIAVKFTIRPEVADQWLTRVAPFTAATRAEPGNVFFEWSRSVDTPHQFVLLEAFRDRTAGEAHVGARQPFVRNGPQGFLTNRVGREREAIRALESMVVLQKLPDNKGSGHFRAILYAKA